MRTRSIAVLIFLLFAYVTVFAVPARAAKTWYVDDSGGKDFTTIQAAINAATSGDAILVYPGVYDPLIPNTGPPCWGGTYPAQGIVVWKPLTIKAVDPNPANTLIINSFAGWMDNWRIQNLTGGVYTPGPPGGKACNPISGGFLPTSSASPNAIMIVSDHVTIEGFTISRPDTTDQSCDAMTFYNTAGILVGGVQTGGGIPLGTTDYFTIKNNVFRDVFQAIFVFHSSYGQILNNHVMALGPQITQCSTDPPCKTPCAAQPWVNHVAILIYDGWGPSFPTSHPSQHNVICYNVVDDKGIEVGAGVWGGEGGDEWPWTNLDDTLICCNTVGDWIAVKNTHGRITLCGNRLVTGGPAYVRTHDCDGVVYTDDCNCPQRAPAVGGVVTPTNTLMILAPYLAVIGLATAAATVYVAKRRR